MENIFQDLPELPTRNWSVVTQLTEDLLQLLEHIKEFVTQLENPQVQKKVQGPHPWDLEDTLRLRKVNKEVAIVLERLISCLQQRCSTIQLDNNQNKSTQQTEEIKIYELVSDDEVVEKADIERSDYSCLESLTSEDDEMSSQASSAAEDLAGSVSVARLVRDHFHDSGTEMAVETIPPNDENNEKQRYGIRCSVLGISAEAWARNRRTAKKSALERLIEILMEKQNSNELPNGLQPFSNQQLQDLKLSLHRCSYVIQLQRKCCELKKSMPKFILLEQPDGNEQFLYTVECSALGYIATGSSTKKKTAKSMAAKKILDFVQEEKNYN